MPRRAETPQRLLTTVLFTDIVGSTKRAAELGDKRWRRLIAQHHSVVRRELRRFGGREIDTAGDGFFATFDQPAQAIRCARSVVQGVRRLGIETRAGVHMGEVETMGPKVGGLTVHIGARIMSQAGPSQVMVSSTVRDLLTGSDIGFDDQGVHELKGVPAQWRLFSVAGMAEGEPAEEPEPGEGEGEDRGRRGPVVPLSIGAAAAVAIAVGVAFVLSGGGSTGPLVAARPNTVVRIDPSAGKVLGAVPVGTTPIPIAAGTQGLWVANSDDATLQRIDPVSNTASPARALPVANTPTGLAVGGGFVWITASHSDTMYKIDPNQAHANTPIRVGFGAAGVAYGEGAVWVTNQDTDSLLRIDPQTSRIRSVHLDSGSAPVGVAVGKGAVWVAESLGRKVLRVDPGTMKVVASVPLLAGNPRQVAVGDGYVWATNPQDDSVFRIDPLSNQGTTIPNIGNGPNGIAVGGGGAWVASIAGGTVAEIDSRSGRVAHVFHLGFSPDGVAVTSGAVWVTLHPR